MFDLELDPSWARALAPVQPELTQLGRFLAAEQKAGREVLPAAPDVLRAFRRPLSEVKVLILGQDPYPTPGHAVGWSFSVQPQVRPLPRSLANIFRELAEDLGLETPTSGDLTPWVDNGVLLLNRVLTVQSGVAGSHRGRGWEAVTDQAITALIARNQPLVAILWGRDAQKLPHDWGDIPRIESPHPSPLSARRGFFGSAPFSRANALLTQQGAQPVDWSLT